MWYYVMMIIITIIIIIYLYCVCVCVCVCVCMTMRQLKIVKLSEACDHSYGCWSWGGTVART